MLILQDTTEFSFKRSAPEKVGFTKVSTGRKLKEGHDQKHDVCGLPMHASLAITPEGLPLGLTAARFWSRTNFKGTTALERGINPIRVAIDQKESMRWLDNLRLSSELAGAPERCVYVGDRKAAPTSSTAWPKNPGPAFSSGAASIALRRMAAGAVAKVMAQVQSSGTHEVRFCDLQGNDHCPCCRFTGDNGHMAGLLAPRRPRRRSAHRNAATRPVGDCKRLGPPPVYGFLRQ